MKGTALHFVPGYIPVVPLAFLSYSYRSPVLPLIPPHLIYFNGLSDTTKRNKKRSVRGIP